VLGADVVVVEVARLLDGVLDHLLGARSLRELAHRDHLGAALDKLLDLEADLAEVDVEVLQHVRADTRPFLHEAEQDVLRPDVLVVEALGLLVGQGHHLAGRSVSRSNMWDLLFLLPSRAESAQHDRASYLDATPGGIVRTDVVPGGARAMPARQLLLSTAGKAIRT
jgi:hypothetical protein